jgi:hypothetical protein
VGNSHGDTLQVSGVASMPGASVVASVLRRSLSNPFPSLYVCDTPHMESWSPSPPVVENGWALELALTNRTW